MNQINYIQKEVPNVNEKSIQAVLLLTQEGSTLPFIARYRKEATGGMDEVQIQKIIDANETFNTLTQRQQYILGEITRQGKLTDELKNKILSCFESTLLEDLYLPYKVKKKSKATLAKEAGLGELADWLWNVGHGTEKPAEGLTLDLWALTFKNEEKGFESSEKCLAGAQDILIERLSERADLRSIVREAYFEKGTLCTTKAEKAKPNSKFENYFNYHESINVLLKPENSHRYLAIRRGWMEEELKIDLGAKPEDQEFDQSLLRIFENEACKDHDTLASEILLKAAKSAYKVHVVHAIENEVHKKLKEVADEAAIQVFSDNVRKLLLASPYGPKAVLGVDPGIRTGCKLAVINSAGKFVADSVIHLQTDEQKSKAKEFIKAVISAGEISAVAVGNGTAGRETETFMRQTLKEVGLQTPVVMVNEAGASVYSASEIAREEFPELDVTVRGAISIARRLQDPLSELVKVDPKSIGVGQYQHDVSPHSLKKSLELVVDTCVNSVGVNLNTASPYLLSRVSGIGPSLAKSIVEYRNAKGIFKNKKELLEVSRFSNKTFEQAAGFLRVPESEDVLDHTGVHPERFELLNQVASKLGKPIKSLIGREGVSELKKRKSDLKNEIDTLGSFTWEDILKELEKPGRDPRESFVPFSFRDDIFELKDLKTDMICPGIVTNVTNFGAFVDIGVHQDGLVHLSQLSQKYIKDPKEVVSPGDRVTVKVIEVNLEKKQIQLSIKAAQTKTASVSTVPIPQAKPQFSRSEKPAFNTRKFEDRKLPKDSRDSKDSRPQMSYQPPKDNFKNNPFAALGNLNGNLKKK